MPELENIVIDISSKDDGLDSSIEKLVQTKRVSAEIADQYKKDTATYQQFDKDIDKAASSQKKFGDESVKTSKNIGDLASKFKFLSDAIAKGGLNEVAKGVLLGIKDGLKDAGQEADNFGDKVQESTGKAETGTKSLTAQLRAMKNELTLLEDQGKENTQEFENLAVSASKLEDRIGDTSRRIRLLAQDGKNIRTLAEGLQGVVAAFSVAQGARALFGDDNKELQETLVKLNAALALMNGLQQLSTIIQKESLIYQRIANIQRRASAVAIGLESAAEKGNIVTRIAATIAQKALNAAMAVSPTGIILTAITAIAGAMLYFSNNTNKAVEAMTELNEVNESYLRITENVVNRLNESSQSVIQSEQHKLDLLKASGAERQEQMLQEAKIDEIRATNAELAANATKRQYGDLTTAIKNYSQELENEKFVLDGIDESDDKQREAQQKKVENLSSTLELIKAVNKENIDASNQQDINEAARESERAKILKDKTDKEIEEHRKLLLARLNDEKAAIEIGLLTAAEGSDEELRLRNELIRKIRDIELQGINLTKNQRILLTNKANKEIEDNNLKAGARTLTLAMEKDKSILAARLAQTKEDSIEELRVKQDQIENAADIEKSNAGITAEEILRIDAETFRKKEDLHQDYLDKIAAAEKKARDEQEKKIKEAADKELEDRKRVMDFMFSSYQQLADFAFSIESENNSANEQSKLFELNRRKEIELENKRLTEEQKKKIDEKYRKQEAAIKKEAWENQKEMEIEQAIINGLLAISAILADPSITTLAKPIAIATAIITNSLQVAGVKAKKTPKFHEGTELVGLAQDEIMAILRKKERVVPEDVNMDYFPALSAIQNRRISPHVANRLLSDTALAERMDKMPAMRDSFPRGISIDEGIISRMISLSATMNMDYRQQAKFMAQELGLLLNEMAGESDYKNKRNTDSLEKRLKSLEEAFRERQTVDTRRL